MSNFDGEIKLKKDIEQIIAKYCLTTGLNNGRYYRYPVHYRKNGQNWVSKGNGTANVDESSFSTMHYKFGADRMDIGKAINEIIKLLEDECDLDTYYYKYDWEND